MTTEAAANGRQMTTANIATHCDRVRGDAAPGEVCCKQSMSMFAMAEIAVAVVFVPSGSRQHEAVYHTASQDVAPPCPPKPLPMLPLLLLRCWWRVLLLLLLLLLLPEPDALLLELIAMLPQAAVAAVGAWCCCCCCKVLLLQLLLLLEVHFCCGG